MTAFACSYQLQFSPHSPLITAMNNKMSAGILKIPVIFLLLAGYVPAAYAEDAKQESKAGKAVPPIYLAAKQGNLAAVRSLIAEGSDVNSVNASGRSALMSAVFFSQSRYSQGAVN